MKINSIINKDNQNNNNNNNKNEKYLPLIIVKKILSYLIYKDCDTIKEYFYLSKNLQSFIVNQINFFSFDHLSSLSSFCDDKSKAKELVDDIEKIEIKDLLVQSFRSEYFLNFKSLKEIKLEYSIKPLMITPDQLECESIRQGSEYLLKSNKFIISYRTNNFFYFRNHFNSNNSYKLLKKIKLHSFSIDIGTANIILENSKMLQSFRVKLEIRSQNSPFYSSLFNDQIHYDNTLYKFGTILSSPQQLDNYNDINNNNNINNNSNKEQEIMLKNPLKSLSIEMERNLNSKDFSLSKNKFCSTIIPNILKSPFQNISKIYFEGIPFSEYVSPINFFSSLSRETIIKLKLVNCFHEEDCALEYLLKYLNENQNLKRLSIRNNNFTDKENGFGGVLKTHKSLTKVDISFSGIQLNPFLTSILERPSQFNKITISGDSDPSKYFKDLDDTLELLDKILTATQNFYNKNYIKYRYPLSDQMIFGNIYIAGLIFKLVKKINIEIILLNRFSEFPAKDPRKKYNDITFEWIVINKEYSILLDFYKSVNIDKEKKKVIPNSTIYEIPIIELKNNLKSFLLDINSIFNNNQELLKDFFYKFYIINKANLNDILVEVEVLGENDKKIMDLLEITVFCSNFQFLIIIYQEYYNNLEKTKLKLEKLLDFTFKNGNIDILKFLYNVMGCREYNKSLAINNCIQSENWNEILKFLINELKHPTHHSSLNLTTLETFKFLQIDNDLFSKFWNVSFPFDYLFLKVDSIPFKNLYNLIQNYFSPRWKDFSKHLEYINNLNQNDINFDTNPIYKFIDKKYFKQLFNNENSLMNGLKSIFKSKNSQKPPFQLKGDCSRLDILKFRGFTTEREIKRLFICYVLMDFKYLLGVVQFLNFVVKFIDDYKEYDLFNQLLDSNQCFFNSHQNDKDGNPRKAFSVIATKYPNVFTYLFKNYHKDFDWHNKALTSLAISNNNLELLKFMLSNSIPIKSTILDLTSCDDIDIIKYLLSKNLKFSKTAIYNCVKKKKVALLELYLSNLSPENSTIGNESIGTIIIRFSNTENSKILFNSSIVKKFIDNDYSLPNPPYLN